VDGVRIARLRWRLRGARLWPTFLLLLVLDAIGGHELPPEGDGQSLTSAALVAMVAMLIGIAVLSPALGLAIRRITGGMPSVVARDYAGTAVILLISAALLAVGLAHHGSVNTDRAAAARAVARADAWIAARAPRAFRTGVLASSTYAIQPDSVYRICVPDPHRTRTYCVVVKLALAPGRSVSFSGYEPNSVLSEGTG
jgi:hypothetical protein